MTFDCSIRAPHGGMWAIGVAQNPLMCFVAILAAVSLELLKKRVEASKKKCTIQIIVDNF